MPKISDYVRLIEESLSGTEEEIDLAIRILRSVVSSGRKIWVLGNGGSLAIAQHFAQDLIKLRRVEAQTISCPSILTAFTNDDGFERVYELPLNVLAREDDAIVVFSCSGKSRNYANILKRRPLIVIVGTDGGWMKSEADVQIHVKSNNYQVCESAFSIVADLINIGMEGVR